MNLKPFTFLLIAVLLIPLLLLGCTLQNTSELEDRIAELEDKLEEKKSSEAEEEAAGIDRAIGDILAQIDGGSTGEEVDSENGADAIDTEGDDTYIETQTPTISLEVYEGPVYSVHDDICYWKIRANVTGTPYPRIEFNRDDSVGAWGLNRVQVNLYSPDETFILTATATNSEGSATDSITLDWGCEVPETEPDIDSSGEDTRDTSRPSEDTVSIPPDFYLSGIVYESGSFIYSTHTLLGLKVIVGDAGNNDQIKAYISFNIDELHGKNVEAAEISIVQTKRADSHPEKFAKTVDYKAFNYGSSLDSGDFAVGGVLLERVPVLTTSYTVSGTSLESELQSVLDDYGREYFQIKIGLNVKTNNDELQDDIVIDLRDVSLHVRYSD
jgi:hypothetical protein